MEERGREAVGVKYRVRSTPCCPRDESREEAVGGGDGGVGGGSE
jgi:hypothetical protein